MNKINYNNIPDGWGEIAVGKVFSFLKSYAISRENLINGTSNNEGIGNIHYGDIHSTYGKPNINLKDVSVPLVKDVEFIPKLEDLLRNGDLIMADVSEDYAGIGVTVSVHGLDGKRVVGGLHTFVLRDTRNKTIERYRQYIFRNPNIRNQLQKIANGVSVYGISKTSLSNLLLILPPLPEQKRIAAVLETWDSYLEKLSRKIELKKNIKKGLMQQLLTGKKRLKEFNCKWKNVRLGDLTEVITKGTTPTTHGFVYQDTGVLYIKVESLSENGQLLRDKVAYISPEAHKFLKRSQLKENDILFSIAGALGRVHKVKSNYLPANTNQALAIVRLKPKLEVSFDFTYLYLKSNAIKSWVRNINVQAAQANISLKDISNIMLILPEINEQNVIADILIKADDEIESLEQKKKIIENQRTFLLNNLITGRIRTPESMKV